MMSLLQVADKGKLIRAGKAKAETIGKAVNSALSKPRLSASETSNTSLLCIEKIEEIIQLSTNEIQN